MLCTLIGSSRPPRYAVPYGLTLSPRLPTATAWAGRHAPRGHAPLTHHSTPVVTSEYDLTSVRRPVEWAEARRVGPRAAQVLEDARVGRRFGVVDGGADDLVGLAAKRLAE